MGAISSIEWTDATWNPIRGCSRVGPECDRCYAMHQARRFDFPAVEGKRKQGAYFGLTRIGPNGPDWSGKVSKAEDHLLDPVRWQAPRRIFVASMSDPFHPAIPRAWQDEINAVMAFAQQHTYQQLTKRADRQRAYYSDPETPARIVTAGRRLGLGLEFQGARVFDWPLPNLIVGTSIGVGAAAPRAFDLAATPARRRFISFEPLLEDVADAVEPALALVEQREKFQTLGPPLIGWGIIGGESGNGARGFDLSHARRLLVLFKRFGIAPYVKQLGARPYRTRTGTCNGYGKEIDGWDDLLRLKHPKGADMAEWPTDLRVRKFPPEALR